MKITETSKIETLNAIGKIVKRKGYEPIFFTRNINGFTVYYLHITKNNQLHLSIYFDKHTKLAFEMPPYFGLYDLEDIERFVVGEEEELIERVKELL